MTDTTTTESERYLAICPGPYTGSGYFGKGATVDEAKQNAKNHGGKLNRFIVYRMPDGATNVQVDDLGQVRWRWDREDHPLAGKRVTLEVVAKRGVEEE